MPFIELIKRKLHPLFALRWCGYDGCWAFNVTPIFNVTPVQAGLITLCVLTSQLATAQTDAIKVKTLGQVIDVSVQSNPDVRSSWHQLNAAAEERRAAFAAYLPQASLTATGSKVDSENPQFGGEAYNSTRADLTITQNIYNGQITHQVHKLDDAIYARYFELRAKSESVALEAAQAYVDLLRYQALVTLAKDSYIEHKLLHSDIERRAQAGITRAVDFEQAQARLALAESNLLTENANLHDVTVRFTRLLGAIPATDLREPDIPKHLLPRDIEGALTEAYTQNPSLLASLHAVSSSDEAIKEHKSAFHPTLDLRARKSVYDDDAINLPGAYDESAIELVLSYPLFAGGRNSATVRQFREEHEFQRQQKELTCRNVTQTVTIAFNNLRTALHQVELNKRNQQSIGKVRTAYRNQFQIGQRSLLDLLDTENEYFDVERAATNAKFDTLSAELAVLAGIGRLTKAFTDFGLQSDAIELWEITPRYPDKPACEVNTADLKRLQKRDIIAEALSDPRLDRLPAPLPPKKEPLTFTLNVQYQNNSAALLPSYFADVEKAANYLKKHPKVKAIIEGHSDSIGSAAYNLNLSQARAESMKSVLIREYGIPANRLRAIGYGEQVPIASNDTAEGRKQNRRVVMVIIEE